MGSRLLGNFLPHMFQVTEQTRSSFSFSFSLPLVLAVPSSGARDLTLSGRGGGTGSKGTTVAATGSFSDSAETEDASESHALTGETAFGCAPASTPFVLRALSTADGPDSCWLDPSGSSMARSRAVNSNQTEPRSTPVSKPETPGN